MYTAKQEVTQIEADSLQEDTKWSEWSVLFIKRLVELHTLASQGSKNGDIIEPCQ